jgi:hypothetical protein
MEPVWQSRAQYAHRIAKVRVGALATRQCGRITWAQMVALEVPPTSIRRWKKSGYLIPVLPRVYAVGHLAPDPSANLFSLVLFAGPNAAISHGTAAHWRGWLRYPVNATHVSTPRRVRAPHRGVVIHPRCEPERELVRGVPCTSITQTLLDLAATEPLKLVKRALAQLDYERKLDPAAVHDECGRGRPGSSALLTALGSYIPQMARTKSDLEDDFLLLCQRFKIPMPEVNVYVHDIEVDCHWPQLGLVVELDGGGNHATSAQRNRDYRNALTLRAEGLTVIRYTNDQVTRHAATVAGDVLGQLERLRGSANALYERTRRPTYP